MGEKVKAKAILSDEQVVVRYREIDATDLGKRAYFTMKRTFDVVVAVFAIVLTSPVLLITAIFIKLEDGGAVFYRQQRIGKGGKEFTIFKFRSMCLDADEKLKEILKNNATLANEYKKNAKIKNDPRITKVGNIIRKMSIDELPQLVNIIKGDMSIIGNRPYLVSEKKAMGAFYDNLLLMKPGLTGYWQVSGRSNQTFKERLKLESYYSDNASIKMDIKIFFKTFAAVIGAKGAE